MNKFAIPEAVEIAGFKITKFGSLKRKESKWFVDRDRYVMNGMVLVLQIAQEIAATEGIDPAVAYQIVSGYGSENGSELLVPYADRLEPLLDLLNYQERTPADAVTMILQSRTNPAWLKENALELRNSFGIEYNDSPHWLPNFTDELPEATIDQLWEFIQGERRQWAELKVATQAEQDDPVGEDSASTVNSSPPTTTNTGTTATGQSNAAPSTTPGLMPTSSKKIPATFSSKH
jgi:hypothetical protein